MVASKNLDDYLFKPENQWFERKSGKVAAKDLAKPLVAFANAEGGTLVVGVSEDSIDGILPERINDIRQAAIDYTDPTVKVNFEEREIEGKTILIMDIAPSDFVHETSSGDCYVRIGDESRILRHDERQELEYDRGYLPFDGTPSPSSNLSDELIDNFRKTIGASSNEKALRARNLLTSQDEPNVAAYLLFSSRPQTEYPSALVRVVKYLGDTRGAGKAQTLEAGADFRFEGNLPQQIREAAKKIDELIPKRRILGSNGEFTDMPIIPRDAWLEGVVNAVTHRSYSIMGNHIRVEIFSNRLEISNPGKFPSSANLDDPLSINRCARNPRIARVLADMNITQELGEGIRRIVSEMRKLGLEDPIYSQKGNEVRLTLLSKYSLSPEIKKSIHKTTLKILRIVTAQNRPLGTGEIVELANMSRPTVLRHLNLLLEKDLIQWKGKSISDPRASWIVL